MIFVFTAPYRAPLPRRRARGFSLVELMVALLIGLVLTLAMFSALMMGESHKRTTGSVTEMDQSGAYAASMMDTVLRNAGSGLVPPSAINPGLLGCHLNFGSVLPASSLPAPFDKFLGGRPNALGVAPVLIAKNQSSDGKSDVLVVMGGSGAAGGIPRTITASGNSTSLNLTNTVGINSGDLVLLSAPGNSDCIIEPVSATTDTTLMLGGEQVSEGPGNLAGMLSASGSFVTPLGSLNSGDMQFQLLGVDGEGTLYGYDLLKAGQAQALANNVLALHALYGIDNMGDGKLHAWQDPGAAGYDIDTMMHDPAKLQHVVAIRVALVLKGNLREKEKIRSSAPTWFNSNLSGTGVTSPAAQSLELNEDDKYYRYRVVEFMVPVRNNLLSQS